MEDLNKYTTEVDGKKYVNITAYSNDRSSSLSTSSNIEKLGFNEKTKYTIDELKAIKQEQEDKIADAAVFDPFTGEECRCRSPLTKGSFTKLEVNTEESMTDSTLYESLDDTIKKMSRADAIRALKSVDSAFNNKEEPDFDDLDVTQSGNFDLCDIPEAMENAKIKDSALAKAKSAKIKEPTATAAEPATTKEPEASVV